MLLVNIVEGEGGSNSSPETGVECRFVAFENG